MKLILYSLTLLSLTTGLIANSITLYPNKPTYMQLTFQEQPIYKGYIILTRLPKGIIPNTIQINLVFQKIKIGEKFQEMQNVLVVQERNLNFVMVG